MANEIAISAELRVSKVGRFDGLAFPLANFTLTGTRILHNVQNVGFAAAEALILGEIVAGGWLMMVNRDPTNFISVRGAAGAVPLVELKTGECALFRLHPSATAPTVQADTAACDLEYLLLEN